MTRWLQISNSLIFPLELVITTCTKSPLLLVQRRAECFTFWSFDFDGAGCIIKKVSRLFKAISFHRTDMTKKCICSINKKVCPTKPGTCPKQFQLDNCFKVVWLKVSTDQPLFKFYSFYQVKNKANCPVVQNRTTLFKETSLKETQMWWGEEKTFQWFVHICD